MLQVGGPEDKKVEVVTDQRNVQEMQKYMEFDRTLKERVMVKEGELYQWRYKMQKTWFSWIKTVVVVQYYIITPFL